MKMAIEESGGARVSKKNLSKFERDIESAIFGTKILRNQLKLEVLNPQNWKQAHNVFYKNKSNERLKYVMITPREKEVQRNLLIYDSQENRLATVPSYLVEQALCGICEYYLSKAYEAANDEERKILNELKKTPIKFGTIFSHDDKEKNIKKNVRDAKGILEKVASDLEKFATTKTENSYSYIRRILTLVSPYEDLYIPVVQLKSIAKREECFSIRYSIEKMQKNPISSYRFLLFGVLSITIPLELERFASNHITILSPKDLFFRHAGVTGLEGTGIEDRYKDLSKFFDGDMICFNVSLEDTEKIHQHQSKSVADEEVGNDSSNANAINSSKSRKVTAKKKIKKPIIEIDLGISSGNFLQRPSLIRTLIFLMYMAIFIPAIAFFVCKSYVTTSLLMNTLILEVTILVSIGIYSMDNPFLPEYITIQVVILLFLFILEIIALLLFF